MSDVIIEVKNFNAYYADKKAVKDANLKIEKNKITAIMGPSGCGKSTLLRSINRINDLVPEFRTEGEILFHDRNIYDRETDVYSLRRRIGMVFQRPTPFPMSIFDNIAYGLKLIGVTEKKEIKEKVRWSLEKAALWEEVKDELDKSALKLSGGQQQRLCIARAIAIEPEVILFDEPTSALDPVSTQKIEGLIEELAEEFTIIIVTHNIGQAARISDYTLFMYQGEIVEQNETTKILRNPTHEVTQQYLSGKIG
ncbi:MAG TPA: phosphate ABC transporter ATP-binding protein PstB [Fervidobacterium sp.]|jgi:phosphate transport system ATP-binding protein|nr:phosphate ABC transporter ATP-binding protein [Fervidobacterium sp.]NLH36507.1 phosphate ABC transporter ATP-binding protein [Thermotogaceae bacterium]MBP8657690.1 phosphate ABC transporter ATP-binding protein [Fervidobacterium sp.]HOA17367.1 phosphate ABC transporter ATP-binding protein PstB [Fervidobacterium sp.]HOH52934.1 phosphate ABC transporter ATP-binding protein PstB [Fervidobacterium sp.]